MIGSSEILWARAYWRGPRGRLRSIANGMARPRSLRRTYLSRNRRIADASRCGSGKNVSLSPAPEWRRLDRAVLARHDLAN
jgi:hypothetical protein